MLENKLALSDQCLVDQRKLPRVKRHAGRLDAVSHPPVDGDDSLPVRGPTPTVARSALVASASACSRSTVRSAPKPPPYARTAVGAHLQCHRPAATSRLSSTACGRSQVAGVPTATTTIGSSGPMTSLHLLQLSLTAPLGITAVNTSSTDLVGKVQRPKDRTECDRASVPASSHDPRPDRCSPRGRASSSGDLVVKIWSGCGEQIGKETEGR
jgi:hypothetical protein